MTLLRVTDLEMGCEFCKPSWRLVGFAVQLFLSEDLTGKWLTRSVYYNFYHRATKVFFWAGCNLLSPYSCLSKPFWIFSSQQDIFNLLVFHASQTFSQIQLKKFSYGFVWLWGCVFKYILFNIDYNSYIVLYDTLKSKI